MGDIYVTRDWEEQGPYSREEAARLIEKGELKEDDRAWQAGEGKQMPLGELLRRPPAVPGRSWGDFSNLSRTTKMLLGVGVLGALGFLLFCILLGPLMWALHRGDPVKLVQSPETWPTSSFAGLSLRCPYDLKKPAGARARTTGAYAADAVVWTEKRQAMGEELIVLASVTEYRPGTEIDLNLAVKSRLAALAEAENMRLPYFNFNSETENGRPERAGRVTLEGTSKTGKPSYCLVHFLLIQSGNKVAEVETVLFDPEEKLSEEILKSVKLE